MAWSMTNKYNVYIHPDGNLRSVHVDSEPKVLQRISKESKQGELREENIIQGRRGRGTNWALGYHGIRQEQEDNILEASIDAVRKEAERCNCYSGTVMMHSISGGTGSGVGSHLSEMLRDEMPIAHLMNCVVAPHVSGESPLQHYNALLCLTWLQRYSDSIVLFKNDEVLHRLQKRQKEAESGISFGSMNKHIASCMAGVFLPVDSVTPSSGISIGQEPWEMMRSVCPMPNLKFVHLNQLSRSKLSWENIASGLCHTVQKYDATGNTYSSLGNLVVARGDITQTFSAYQKQVEAKVKAAYNPVNWNPFPVDFWRGRLNPVGSKDSASLTVASNHSSVVSLLEHVLSRARQKFDAKAYLHWYIKHGCEEEDFREAFASMERVISDYKDAVR